MLTWKTPCLEDKDWVQDLVIQQNCMGSDTSFANIYLLRNKYDTKISRYNGFLIRKYYGQGSRYGYTFPLGSGDLDSAIKEILMDAKEHNEKVQFCLLTQEQKAYLENHFPDQFTFDTDEGDSDYIYAQQDLALLSGKAYHKKKNHVSKFKRTYPEFTFVPIEQANTKDAMQIQDVWYYDHLQTEDESQLKEHVAIKEALEHFDELGLMGGILYISDIPVAMTIASAISQETCDIHFEKVVGECALFGGYSTINMLFAQKLEEFQWINREEDIGIEGLRKAKSSYHPKLLLNKYSAVEK